MDDRLKQIQKLLDAAEGNLHSARNLMREVVGSSNAPIINPEEKAKDLSVIEEGKIIEGVYDGENMIGPDGKDYQVPANYASKSKLVEGDVLKLTIADDGSFIYKQIKPIDRRKTVGTLTYSNGSYAVNAEGKSYKVLQASVTYYKGEAGDQVSLILPKEHDSNWGAIENIIKKVGEDGGIVNSDEQPSIAEAENISPSPLAEPAEPTAQEPAEDTSPKIEFPNGTDEVQEIIDKESTEMPETQGAPIEPVVEENAATEPKKQDEQGGQGIKELEI